MQHEVDAVWSSFERIFEQRMRCIDDVHLLLVADVDGGDARYVVAERLIEIEIPTSPRRFRDSLAHELAHHVEHSCKAFDRLGMSLDAWFSGPSWQTTPSEQWAEAVVQLLLGERVRHGRSMPINPDLHKHARLWIGG